jgi:peptidoglycan/LPS O-acetylase OafA/YrhL
MAQQGEAPRSTPATLTFLDGLRGLAALYVMLGHARWLLWEGYSDGYKIHPDHYSAAGKLLVHAAAFFRFGHEAVLFFFVLSGFVIHLKQARRMAALGPAAPFDLGAYAARRARRLYPPLVAALLLTLALDTLGRYLGSPIARGATIYPSINHNVGADHGAMTALRNLVFIMDPVFGSDGPLWSLGYEGYFYLLYPAALALARRSWRAATAALAALSVIGFLPGWPGALLWLRGICQLMIVWWLGALLADRWAGRFRVRYAAVAWLTAALAVIPIWRWDPVVRDVVIGFGFTGLIAAGLAATERGRGPAARAVAGLGRLAPLGAMSYTLYVVHFPILAFMSGLLMKRSGGPLPEHFGWAAAGVAVATGVAYLLHLAVERPFTSR